MTTETKVVTKSLGGAQDLLMGLGPVLQLRAGQQVSVQGLYLPFTVETNPQLADLDVLSYTYGAVVGTEYKYDASATSGIKSNTGVGYWVPYIKEGVKDYIDTAITNIEDEVTEIVNASIKIPVQTFASYDQNNVVQAMKDSRTQLGYVYFKSLSGEANTTFKIIGDQPDLYGVHIYSDTGTVLEFDYDYYPFLGSLIFHDDCSFKFTSKNFTTEGISIPKIQRQPTILNNPQTLSSIPFTDCKPITLLNDTWTTTSYSATSDTAALIPNLTGSAAALMVPVDIGETISAFVRGEANTPTRIGILLRCDNGWYKLYNSPGALTNWSSSFKVIGSAEVAGSAFSPPDPLLASYSAGKTVVGIAVTSSTSFEFLFNGTAAGLPFSTGPLGIIHEVGFFTEGSITGTATRVTGVISYKSEKIMYGAAPISLLIVGDSTAEKWLSTFDEYLPGLLDGYGGSRVLAIENRAVAGETFATQFARLKTEGPGQANIIIMVGGTNEGQGGVSADAFASLVNEFYLWCLNLSRTPMWVEPWMWYSSSFIGGKGQSSANYENVGELREAGKRTGLKYSTGITVSTTHALPAPLPKYFNSALDPLLRDDIHQSLLGYRLYAELIAAALVKFRQGFTYTHRPLAKHYVTTASTGTASNTAITSNSLCCDLTVTAVPDGGAIIDMPRWARPPSTRGWPGLITTASSPSYQPVRILYQNGQLRVDGTSPKTAGTIVINISW